jgi:cation:H+ antiporter
VMVGTAVLVLPLARSGFRVQRWEGALLLMGYAAYMVWLFSRGT